MDTPKKRRKEEVLAFRNAVLDTALLLMQQERDWNKVSVNAIAKIMRYTPPNIYHYFKNKSDIESHLLERGLQKLNDLLNGISETYTDPKDTLLNIARKYWSFAFENEELYQIAFMRPQSYGDMNLVKNNIQIIMDVLKQINPVLEGDKRAAYYTYQSFYSILHGYVSTRIINKNAIPDTKYFEAMVEFLVKNFMELVQAGKHLNMESPPV